MASAHNTVEFSWIEVGTMADDTPLRIALYEVAGKPGPTAAVLGTVHGDEPLTAETARRAIEELRSADLTGTVLVLPVINPLAFESYSRNTWVDMANLNRCFPGNPSGTVSEQIAHAITTSVLDRSDALIDLHSGTWQFITDYSYAYPGSEAFASAFGSMATIRRPPIGGSSAKVLGDRGKPVVIAEFGGGLFEDERFIQKGVAGTLSCLRFLKMLRDSAPQDRPVILHERMHWFRPRHGGLMIPEFTGPGIGQTVLKDTLLGRIMSPYSFRTLEEFRAPFDRNLIAFASSGLVRVNPGDYTYMVVEEI